MKLPAMVGALLLMGSVVTEHHGADALRINLQPRNMLQPRFHHSSLMSPSFSSAFDDFLLSSIFDDPFPRFSWPTSPSFRDNLIGFVPRRQRQCPVQTEQQHQADETRKTLLDMQEKELERKEKELKQERETLERQKQIEKKRQEQVAREQQIQREIREHREKINQAEERLKQEQERRREESAKREREWQEKQRKLKQEREEEKRRQEEMKRKEEMEKEARNWREMQQRREEERNHQKRESQRQQQNVREQAQKRSNRQHQDSFHSRRSQQSQRHSPQKLDIASIQVKGYNPEDISISTNGNRMTISGRHVCGCDESCFEREFQRVYTLPQGTDTTTLIGNIDREGVLTVRGEKSIRNNSFLDSSVPVDGHRLAQQNNDSSCGGRKGGIKLKKMNKRTGEVFENIPMQEDNYFSSYFEEENGDDGITIEVVE